MTPRVVYDTNVVVSAVLKAGSIRVVTMGYQAKKTEHTGAKHGSGAYWGPKRDAKKESSKIRRRDEKNALREQLAECHADPA